MDITVNRHSVCMGDDVENHSIIYTVNRDSTFSSIFRDLISQKYFPNIYGNDVVWVLNCNHDDLATWKTKSNKLYTRFVMDEPKILSEKRWEKIDAIDFSYFSLPARRAKHIFEHFDGKKFHIWHEGFMSEYKSYNISEQTEKEWLGKIGRESLHGACR